MYCLLVDAGEQIKYIESSDTWVIPLYSHDSRRHKVDVLDYSDWSIERVSLTILIKAIQRGDLSSSDFCNLVEIGGSYNVGESYIFPFIESSDKFVAKDVMLRRVIDCDGLEVEFFDGRCLSLCSFRTGKLLTVNYKETINCDRSWCTSYLRAFLPFKNGYTFSVIGFQVYLDPKYFTIKYDDQVKSFPYISRSDLARRRLMSRL